MSIYPSKYHVHPTMVFFLSEICKMIVHVHNSIKHTAKINSMKYHIVTKARNIIYMGLISETNSKVYTPFPLHCATVTVLFVFFHFEPTHKLADHADVTAVRNTRSPVTASFIISSDK